jgi:S1-C subfamily serine protease
MTTHRRAKRGRHSYSTFLEIAALATLASCFAEASEPAPITLQDAVPQMLRLQPGAGTILHTQVQVPSDAQALELRITDATREIEAGLTLGEAAAAAHAAEYWTGTELGQAVLRLDRFSLPPLEPGIWHATFDMGGQLPLGPRGRVEEVSFRAELRVLRAGAGMQLAPGVAQEGVVELERASTWVGHVDVPGGATTLRVDLLEAEADLDLLAYPGREPRDLSQRPHLRSRPYGRETLLIEAPESGPWTIEVVDPHALEARAEFRLLASFAARTPAEARVEPEARGLASAIASIGAAQLGAVVEVGTPDGSGSAVCVHERGLFLTNWHVVQKLGGGASEEIVLSRTLDLARPPRESWRAKVVEHDVGADCALLELVGDRHGDPLPPDLRLVAAPLGDDTRLLLGSELVVVGYPGVGTQRTRPTLTLTRGVVAGFERTGAGLALKSDAEITSGHSGGAAYDLAGRLVGLPTSRVEDGASQLGWIHGLSMLPERIRARIASR